MCKEPIINSSHGKLRDFCNDRLPPEAKFNIPPIQKDQILKFLRNLDVGKATGTDNIGPRLLRYSAPYIVNEIAYIFDLVDDEILLSKLQLYGLCEETYA